MKQLLELPTAPTEGEDSDKPELSARLLYKCLICMRKFRGSNYLKLHMRNHTGRKILLALLYLTLYIQGIWVLLVHRLFSIFSLKTILVDCKDFLNMAALTTMGLSKLERISQFPTANGYLFIGM